MKSRLFSNKNKDLIGTRGSSDAQGLRAWRRIKGEDDVCGEKRVLKRLSPLWRIVHVHYHDYRGSLIRNEPATDVNTLAPNLKALAFDQIAEPFPVYRGFTYACHNSKPNWTSRFAN